MLRVARKCRAVGLTVLPIGVAVVGGVLLLGWWLIPAPLMSLREPRLHPGGEAVQSGPVTGTLTPGPGLPSDSVGSWPRFRGAAFNNLVQDPLELIRDLAAQSPQEVWTMAVGEGYAGATLHNGRLYLLDYDREAQADTLLCLSPDDGRLIWKYSYPVKIKRNHGMSRTVCAVNDRYVVSFGPKCHVACLDAQTGQEKWLIDLTREHGASVPLWYAGQCPLLEGDRVILAIGGRALLMALDCETADILWESPNPQQWQMTHSSIMPMEFAGTRMYVYCASGGVVAVAADDGCLLWELDEWKIRIANVPSPLIVPPDRIFLTGGYNAGSMMLKLVETGQGKPGVKILYRLGPEIFGSTQQTPILHGDHIYGVREDGQLVCLTLDGEEVWSSTSQHRFGLGAYLLVNDLLYVLNDEGILSTVPAEPSGFRLLGQTQALPGHESWGPMAYVDGRLYLRDLTTLTCLELTLP